MTGFGPRPGTAFTPPDDQIVVAISAVDVRGRGAERAMELARLAWEAAGLKVTPPDDDNQSWRIRGNAVPVCVTAENDGR